MFNFNWSDSVLAMLGLTLVEYQGRRLPTMSSKVLLESTNLVRSVVCILNYFFQIWKQNHKLLNCLHKITLIRVNKSKSNPDTVQEMAGNNSSYLIIKKKLFIFIYLNFLKLASNSNFSDPTIHVYMLFLNSHAIHFSFYTQSLVVPLMVEVTI